MTETDSRLAQEIRTLAQAIPGPFPEIAHELRTPLTVIAGYVELLQEVAGSLTPAQQSMLATVDRNVARLWRLVEEVLDSARIEAHAYRTTRSPVPLTLLAAGAAAAAARQAAVKGVTVTACPRGSLTVQGDRVQLERLLTCLLSAAVTSAPAGGNVELTADRSGGAVVLRIVIMGPDCPGPRLTLPSQPSGPLSASLALCRMIAANHGGDLEISPTVVTVRLPVTGIAPEAAGNGATCRG